VSFFEFVAPSLKDKFMQSIFTYEPLRYFGKNFLFESLSRFHIGNPYQHNLSYSAQIHTI